MNNIAVETDVAYIAKIAVEGDEPMSTDFIIGQGYH